MADPPDLSALAKRYVDLWQDQLIALAAHPELAESLARVLRAFPIPSMIWPHAPEAASALLATSSTMPGRAGTTRMPCDVTAQPASSGGRPTLFPSCANQRLAPGPPIRRSRRPTAGNSSSPAIRLGPIRKRVEPSVRWSGADSAVLTCAAVTVRSFAVT